MSLPEPYYQDESCTIYHADCREILPCLQRVDLVLTDPPYGVAFKYREYNDGDLIGYCQLIGDVINLIQDIPILITTGKRNLWSYPPAKDMFCWQKPGSTRRNNFGGFNEWEVILMYGTTPARASSDLIRLPDCVNHDAGNTHPCPKPVRLFHWLINQCSNDTDTILDPFMGSGTTLVAAKQLGRKAIGIEIEEKYVKIAIDRLRQEVLPLNQPSHEKQEQGELC